MYIFQVNGFFFNHNFELQTLVRKNKTMSEWNDSLQMIAIIIASVSFFLSILMMLTFYCTNVSVVKNKQEIRQEMLRRLTLQDEMIYDSEMRIREDMMSVFPASGSAKGPQSAVEQEAQIAELKRKMKFEIIPYVSLLKLRLKQFDKRVVFHENLFQGERKYPGNVDFALDRLSVSPPQGISPQLETGSPKEIRNFYEILKHSERIIDWENILEAQQKKINRLEDLSRLVLDKLRTASDSSNIDTGLLSIRTSDANYTPIGTEKLTEDNSQEDTTRVFANF
ncbi:hypothetical protein Btru_042874 [Bulinus truncatus]|nr:hypothetical protein Btru_042874 [Bulinus truncatus]